MTCGPCCYLTDRGIQPIDRRIGTIVCCERTRCNGNTFVPAEDEWLVDGFAIPAKPETWPRDRVQSAPRDRSLCRSSAASHFFCAWMLAGKTIINLLAARGRAAGRLPPGVLTNRHVERSTSRLPGGLPPEIFHVDFCQRELNRPAAFPCIRAGHQRRHSNILAVFLFRSR